MILALCKELATTMLVILCRPCSILHRQSLLMDHVAQLEVRAKNSHKEQMVPKVQSEKSPNLAAEPVFKRLYYLASAESRGRKICGHASFKAVASWHLVALVRLLCLYHTYIYSISISIPVFCPYLYNGP